MTSQAEQPQSGHVDDVEIVGTLLDDLDDLARTRLERHLARCEPCAERVRRVRGLRRDGPSTGDHAPLEREGQLDTEQVRVLQLLGTARSLDEVAAQLGHAREGLASAKLSIRRHILERCPQLLRSCVSLMQPGAADEPAATGAGGAAGAAFQAEPLDLGILRAVFVADEDDRWEWPELLARLSSHHRTSDSLEAPDEEDAVDAEPERQRERELAWNPPPARGKRVSARTLAVVSASSGVLAAALTLLALRPRAYVAGELAGQIEYKGATALPALTAVCIPPTARTAADVIRSGEPHVSCPPGSEIAAKVSVPAAEWRTFLVVFTEPDGAPTTMYKLADGSQSLAFDPEQSEQGKKILVRSSVVVSLLAGRETAVGLVHSQIIVSTAKPEE